MILKNVININFNHRLCTSKAMEAIEFGKKYICDQVFEG